MTTASRWRATALPKGALREPLALASYTTNRDTIKLTLRGHSKTNTFDPRRTWGRNWKQHAGHMNLDDPEGPSM